MKIKLLRLAALLSVVALSAVACRELNEPEKESGKDLTIISVSLSDADVKTSMGPSAGGSRKVFWTDGDIMSLNGTASTPLSGVPAESSTASFSFSGSPSAPYKLLYPSSFYKDANTITLPATQTFAAGSFATGTEPLCGYSESATNSVALNHLCSVLRLSIKKASGISAGTIRKVTFKGNNGEQVSGDFTIDYAAHTLTGASSADAAKSVALTLSQTLSETEALEVYLVVPAGSYSQGFCVLVEDDQQKVTTKTKLGAATLPAGKLVKMTEFTFTPGNSSFEIEDLTETIIEPDGYNVKGRVVDNAGNPLHNVVVSDGLQSVRTMVNGAFFMTSDVDKLKYVQVSTPSGYMPKIESGLPRYYKAKASVTPAGGVYDFGDFVLTPMANPDRFTILVTADPQPRASDLSLDNVAYRSLRGCESLYIDLTETAAQMTDRQVIGICLGDLVHENMDLMDTYATALGTQSSAATIPVTLRQAEKIGVRAEIAGFVIPLCATIHLSGSTMKIVACSLAIIIMSGQAVSLEQFAGFICMLGVTMVAAPGVPGGAIMAALGILESMLGFGQAELALMIALYIAMDSFGTACNVTGDGAIAVIVDKIYARKTSSQMP